MPTRSNEAVTHNIIGCFGNDAQWGNTLCAIFSFFVSVIYYYVSGLNILTNVSLVFTAKVGGSPERERGADQKHGPPAAGEGAAAGGEGEPAQGV